MQREKAPPLLLPSARAAGPPRRARHEERRVGRRDRVRRRDERRRRAPRVRLVVELVDFVHPLRLSLLRLEEALRQLLVLHLKPRQALLGLVLVLRRR